ncbi:MAG: alpha/beta hydrolase [Chitinophagaceae bacterium]|nr:alpha/beta hydrolase [Chitinophagaceae bacterium]
MINHHFSPDMRINCKIFIPFLKWSAVILIVLFSFSSCDKENQQQEDENLPELTMNDVSYGEDAKQKMDIFLPAGRSVKHTPVLVMIHGGGWKEGDKADFKAYLDTLKRRLPDYAIFNINYRLANVDYGKNLFPTQENDVNDAVSFIVSHLGEYHISNKMALLGASAGGHLALLQGYKYVDKIKVKAIVDFFGPVNMKNMYNYPTNILMGYLILAVMGGTPEMLPDLYYQSSPSSFVNAQSAPTIILHGGIDPLVSPSQSSALRDALQEAGVANQYVFYPNEGHGWVGANLTDSFNQIEAFLRAHVK